MFISQLVINNFRNIKATKYIFKNKINLFYGNNGSGKTSILESIFFLSSGKSFRKGSFKNLINFHTNDFTVFLNTESIYGKQSFAVNKNRNGKWSAKHNNDNISKQSYLTNLVPVIAIEPEIYSLVDHGPSFRRSYLDWLVFHVEHSYLILWKKVYKCIKQLNVLYKQKASNSILSSWEETYIELSESLNYKRMVIFNRILPIILKLSTNMQKEITNLKLDFIQGWSKELSLKQQLLEDRSNNLRFGQMQHGPNKMDISIKVGRYPASKILSRGQKKILSMTFYMASIELLNNQNKIKPIVCIDDLDAEMDDGKLKKVADFFIKSGSQVFITSVQENKITNVFNKIELFHVEHS